jgi:hypothetical protein
MSVIVSDLEWYGSLNMPEADGVDVGGGPDFTIQVSFSDLSVQDTVDWVSSSAIDTAVKAQISGRDSTGTQQTPAAITLTGQTPVTGSQTFQRLLFGIITGAVAGTFPLTDPGGTAAVGDVACFKHTAVISAHTAQTGSANPSGFQPTLFKLQTGDGSSVAIGQILRTISGTGGNQIRRIVQVSGFGTDVVAVNRSWGVVPDNTTVYNVNDGILFPILPNPVTKVTRVFATAAADVFLGFTRYFFEKIFAVNNNTSDPLSTATLIFNSETPTLPSGATIDIGITFVYDDTGDCNPRQQASGFIPPNVSSFVVQPALALFQGNVLIGGSAPNTTNSQGVWLRYTLPAGAAAYNGAIQSAIQGQTT